MQRHLPDSSFVRFHAWRGTRAQTVWHLPGLDGGALREHAYFIPLPGDDGAATGGAGREFLGERYGGSGLSFNGGGARCGLDGAVQIKGIGKNCLAGSATSFWHSYGGETLANGVREAIWSEVIQAALPFGAVRVLGLIDTGTGVPAFSEEGGAEGTVRRGLTLRQPALRPAHFVSSVYFSRADQRRHGLPSEASRTAAALARLGEALHFSLGGDAPAACGARFVAEGLHTLFERFGIQSAVAQAKRIMHGTLNASNLCLDGRWIDFGTISTVSDYGKIILGNAGQHFWDHSRIDRIARELAFYLRKYLPAPQAAAAPTAADLFASFLRSYTARLELEFLKLTGAPEPLLRSLAPATRSALYLSMRSLIDAGNSEPFKLFPPCTAQPVDMPARMGTIHLNTVLQRAALCASAAELAARLRDEIADAALLERFAAPYWALRRHLQAAVEWDAHLPLFFRLNALRVNTALEELYRYRLDADIARWVEQGDSLPGHIERLVASGRTLLADPQQTALALPAWSRRDARLCWRDGAFLDGQRVDAAAFLAALALPPAAPQRQDLLSC